MSRWLFASFDDPPLHPSRIPTTNAGPCVYCGNPAIVPVWEPLFERPVCVDCTADLEMHPEGQQ